MPNIVLGTRAHKTKIPDLLDLNSSGEDRQYGNGMLWSKIGKFCGAVVFLSRGKNTLP